MLRLTRGHPREPSERVSSRLRHRRFAQGWSLIDLVAIVVCSGRGERKVKKNHKFIDASPRYPRGLSILDLASLSLSWMRADALHAPHLSSSIIPEETDRERERTRSVAACKPHGSESGKRTPIVGRFPYRELMSAARRGKMPAASPAIWIVVPARLRERNAGDFSARAPSPHRLPRRRHSGRETRRSALLLSLASLMTQSARPTSR